jgi:hypothetical protein
VRHDLGGEQIADPVAVRPHSGVSAAEMIAALTLAAAAAQYRGGGSVGLAPDLLRGAAVRDPRGVRANTAAVSMTAMSATRLMWITDSFLS